jgi:selenide,water dikinase
VVGYETPISEDLKTLLFDPQTAGGLLISIAEDDSEEFVLECETEGVSARYIGNVTESQKPMIRIY